jgi:hypothetical protein
MSSVEIEILAARRPRGFSGRGDKYLGDIARELRTLLLATQESFEHPTCRLDREDASEVAVVLAEFAEDVHGAIGLWRAVEAHNLQCFETPLPFLVKAGDSTALSTFDPRRLQHLLWTLLPCVLENTILSPTHRDLRRTAEAVSRYLTERFANIPKDSGVKQFLATSNRYGWEIKRKLIWLGRHSYLFRFFFEEYMEEEGGSIDDVSATDDFLCQECTAWSGMGAIDLLAGALDLPEEDRRTLRNWYERHTAFFRVLTRKESGGETEFVTVRNIVNGESYVVRLNMPSCPFTPGMLVFGGLTPWRGEWYWSGEQRSYGDVPEKEEAGLRKGMLERTSGIAYRYCHQLAERARIFAREQHERFVAHYGTDLAIFADGLSLAAGEQKRLEDQWRTAPPEEVGAVMSARRLKRAGPNMEFPTNLLEHEDGIAAFSNPSEGVEYLLEFQHVLSGLKKKGVDLTQRERDALHGTITGAEVCPAFVRRLVAEHGADSIADAFAIRDQPLDLTLDVLLRRHKGRHYRRRYPAVSFESGLIP